MFGGCGSSEAEFSLNTENAKTGMPIFDGLSLYSLESEKINFLYPEESEVIYNSTDGAGIYTNGYGKLPYVLVKRTEKKGMTPKSYFDASNKQILKNFKDVTSTPILESVVDGKTLYMTRYICDGSTVIDRYVELYDDYYVQYSALSEKEGEVDTELYYAIKTFTTKTGAYTEGIATSLTPYSEEDTGIAISLPDMYKVNELTIGYMCTGKDVIMLSILCDSDDTGNPIKNRDDFISRAMSDSTFMAGYLGAEGVTFGDGSIELINGRDYYVYPMVMEGYDDYFDGKIYLGDSSSGCMVVCYAVARGNKDKEEISKLFESSINTLNY